MLVIFFWCRNKLFIASKFYIVFPILSFIVVSTGMTTVDNGPDFHHYSLSKLKVDLAGGGKLYFKKQEWCCYANIKCFNIGRVDLGFQLISTRYKQMFHAFHG